MFLETENEVQCFWLCMDVNVFVLTLSGFKSSRGETISTRGRADAPTRQSRRVREIRLTKMGRCSGAR
jgi:hypothetical protein